MQSFFTSRRRSPQAPANARRVSLCLEPLENRDCPAVSGGGGSTPPSLTFSASILAGNTVHLSGGVTDDHPNMTYVQFSGVISGSAQPNSAGQYDAFIDGSALGTIIAQAHDMLMNSSPTVDATITSNAPTITLNRSYGANGSVILWGHVTDEDAAGHTVTFTGAVLGTATTNNNGDFSLTTIYWSLGDVSASTTDCWGQTSNTATATLANAAPVITSFQAIHTSLNIWTFQGSVTDEYAPGLTVRFDGNLPSLRGQTTTVGADGRFYLTIRLQDNEDGTARAQTTDWRSLDSNEALSFVFRGY